MPKKRRIYQSPLSVAVGFLAERRREKTLSLVANGSAKTSRRWIPCLSISHHERESSRPCGSLMGWPNFFGNCTDSFFGLRNSGLYLIVSSQPQSLLGNNKARFKEPHMMVFCLCIAPNNSHLWIIPRLIEVDETPIMHSLY